MPSVVGGNSPRPGRRGRLGRLGWARRARRWSVFAVLLGLLAVSVPEDVRPDAEFALVVADRYQGQGLGEELLRRLLQFARAEGVRRVVADILPANVGMQRVCERVGLRVAPHPGDGSLMRAEIDI